jgi:hypothetical protein
MIPEIARGVKMSLHRPPGYAGQAGVPQQVDLVSGYKAWGLGPGAWGIGPFEFGIRNTESINFGFWISDFRFWIESHKFRIQGQNTRPKYKALG